MHFKKPLLSLFSILLLGSVFYGLACQSPQKLNSSSIETLVILGTNDLHGTLGPLVFNTSDSPPQTYKMGGMAYLADYIRILKEEWGEHFIWLDAGDQFQGSLESNFFQGQPMVEVFNHLGLSASAVGNHEFDFGLESLKSRMKEAKYPYLTSNILDKSTQQRASFPNSLPHFTIQAGRLKVGIIGLTTTETPTTTRTINVADLSFENLSQATLREAQSLRSQGAHIVLVTAHAGVRCSTSATPPDVLALRTPADTQSSCDPHDEINSLIESLPPGTIDAVVAGHRHLLAHQWIGNKSNLKENNNDFGVPVIQAGCFGKFINLIHLNYDWDNKKIIPEKTIIEGPIPVCSKFFKNQNNCLGELPPPPEGRGEMIPATFHGKEIVASKSVKEILKPYFKKTIEEKSKIIGFTHQRINHTQMAESELGNLVADAIRESTKSDISLMNGKGIRTFINAGSITYGDIYRTLPFDNFIIQMKLKGREIQKILQVAMSGAKGFPSISGISVKLIPLKFPAPWIDLNGDGIKTAWKTNRLLDITFNDGKKLEDEKFYLFSTMDFLVTGGDYLGWPMDQIPETREKTNTGLTARGVFVEKIRNLKEINTEKTPIILAHAPRLNFDEFYEKNKIYKTKNKSKSR